MAPEKDRTLGGYGGHARADRHGIACIQQTSYHRFSRTPRARMPR